MLLELGREEIVLVGFSLTVLTPLAGVLPAGSVVVIEEPDIAVKRDLAAQAAKYPAISRVILWEYQRPDSMLSLLRAEPALKAVRAVLPGVEYAVTAAASLAALLGLPGAGSRAGIIFRDKARQREAAQTVGISNPEYQVVDTAAAAAGFLARVGARCVLKPTARQASVGVQFVATPEEAASAFRQACDVTETFMEPGRGIASQVMIERAISGIEFSVEMLIASGRPVFSNVTAKLVLPGRFPVELGHIVPARQPPGLTGVLAGSTAQLAAASGFENGVLHCEWIVSEQGPVLVECAARMPGDEIGTLITLAYDFSFARAYLLILLGEQPDVPASPRHGAAIQYLTTPPGIVEAVHGKDNAAASPGVHAVTVFLKPGDLVAPVTSSWNRAGYVVACAATPVQAHARAVSGAGLIRVETRPE